ncbi:uncharacterized protein PAC_17350 [Phialocephala subalpina]|uniref:Extracellular membrane protein CFEM domain-containing protein n=1 Tax=Phialocephala subalpina TaxID=576137 RepID=A0A1L7XQW5_9HELO|nr:uncharacterized protein PAC_17350 [Phialocephala subalpina]
MKTSTILLALAASVSANVFHPRADTTSSLSPTTTTYSISPTASCLAACKAGDVTCQAACIGSAHPNSLQVNQTDDCVSKCDKGDGSTSANNAYASCLNGCISSYYPTSQTVSVGGSSATSVEAGTTTGTGKATGTGTATTGTSATGTGSAAASSSTGAAANNGPFIASAGSLAGLFLAFFAL